MLFKEIIQHASDKFRDTRETAYMNVVTKKYVIRIRNKYIYDFWKTVFYFSPFVMQLQMRGFTMPIPQWRSQLGKYNELILHLTKKKWNMFMKKDLF